MKMLDATYGEMGSYAERRELNAILSNWHKYRGLLPKTGQNNCIKIYRMDAQFRGSMNEMCEYQTPER